MSAPEWLVDKQSLGAYWAYISAERAELHLVWVPAGTPPPDGYTRIDLYRMDFVPLISPHVTRSPRWTPVLKAAVKALKQRRMAAQRLRKRNEAA